MILFCLNMRVLRKYVEMHKDEIYCIYAGISNEWETTSDEIYFYEIGWIEDNDALLCGSLSRRPVAYIHYKDDVDDEHLIDSFRMYEVF